MLEVNAVILKEILILVLNTNESTHKNDIFIKIEFAKYVLA